MVNQNTVEPTKSSPDLFRKSVKGGAWVFALRIATQVLSIGRYILLMNLLQVSDMGLLGIAFLLIQSMDVLTATGFNAALIQKKGQVDSYLNSAWVFGIIRAFLLFMLLYFGAPVFAGFKDIPPEEFALTVSVIRVLGLTFLIGAFNNIGIIYFKKELEFHKQFFIEIFPTLISIIVTVVLVLIYKSVWSLVLGRLSAGVFRCLFSYLMHSYRPRIEFDISKVKELWGFGKWVLGATIVGFVFKNGDDFFVWSSIDAAALGLYQAAYKLSNIPATEITHVISQVSFPAYSKLQGDIQRLRKAYFKVLQLSSCLSIPIAAMIFVLAPDFVELFLKPDWQPIIPAMQILAIFGMIRSLSATLGPVVFALGYVKMMTKANFVQLMIMLVLIYPMTKRDGFVGTSLAVTLASFLSIPLVQIIGMKLLKYKLREPFKIVFVPLFSAMIMVASVFLLKMLFPDSSIINFIIMVLVGIITYSAVLASFDLILDYGIIKAVKEQLSVFRK